MFVEPLEQRVLLTGDMEIEPDNDTITGATALTLLDDPVSSGMFTAYGDGEIDPATSGDYWSDPDYWEFPALAGDIVSIAVATPASDVDPYVELRNSADGVLSSNSDSGADTDAFISHSVIESSGNYFVRVGKAYSSTVAGAYQLRVDVARGINLESDADYSNDSIGGANLLDLDQGAPGEVVGTVSGTIMASQGTNTDEDYYSLGVLDPGNIINLDILLPSISPLVGKVRVVDSSDADLTDSDGDANDDSFTGTVVTSDEYYAVVEANSGSGPLAQYLLDIDIDDTVSPTVADVVGLPEEGETSSEVISSLSVTFSERMDPDTVLASGAFDLREAGVDGVFDFGGTSDDVIVNLVAETTFDEFTRTIEFFLQEGPLSSGDYRFTIANTVEDRAGNQLDGDGSGVGGDPFIRNFMLDLPADFVLEGPNNNEITGATALPLTEDPSGLFLAFGLGSQDPAAVYDYWSDPDYWRFDAEAGDRVAIAVDTPDSDVDPYVELRDASDSYLTADSSSGPGSDAYISHYTILSAGTYYLRVGKDYYSTATGSYQVRVELARGIELESDTQYNNDSISGADLVTLVQQGNQRNGTVAGTIMAPEGTNRDEDRYQLGLLNVGNVIDLQVALPSSSSLVPVLRVVDSSETELVDEDGDPTNGFQATVTADGEYYAEVSNEYWVYNGHRYERLSNQDWDSAEAAAVDLGGHLATIDDRAEQNWVQQAFGGLHLWIGLHDADDTDTFVWVDDTLVEYTNWASGYPTSTSSYDGVYINSGNGLWYNIYKSWTGAYGLAEWIDPLGRSFAGAGPLAQYVLDITVTDPIPPVIIDVSRLPDGGTTDQLISTFNVTVSEDLDPQTVNTPVYTYAIYNGHTYLLADPSQSWNEGEAQAQALGGHLVTIDDQTEQDWIVSTFGAFSQYFWIGLTDQDEQGNWTTWADGTPVVHENWASGYPIANSGYDFGYLYTSDGFWYNYPTTTSSQWRGLIEIPTVGDSDSDGTPDEVDSHPADPFNGWDLREAGTDGIFDSSSTPSTDDVIYDLRLASTYTSGTNISLQVYDGPMHDGNYRLTITSSLTDVVGNQLDGDGDSTAGGNYVQEFFVDLPDGFVYEGRSNDTLVEATPLTLVEDPAGSGLYLPEMFGLGSQDPAAVYDYWSDPDYWRFDAEAGDRVAIAVDTPDSDVDPYVELRDASDSSLTSDSSSGPGSDAYISHYTILSAGTYYLRVGKDYYSTATGSYQVRVELARGIELESDTQYNNDSISGADLVTLVQQGNQRNGTVAGTIMAPEGTNRDEDRYQLGLLNVGNVIDLQVALPSSSSLVPVLRVVDSSETELVDEDGDPTNGFQATVTADGEYYAEVSNEYWVYNSHRYERLSNQDWDSAEAAAVALGGHLATIDDQSEQNWVYQTFGAQHHWIGLHDDTADADPDTFVWVDGTPVSYTNWASGYPTSTSSYDGVYINSGNGLWYNYVKSWTGANGLAEWTDPDGRDFAGAGPLAQYVLDITVTDPIPPEIIDVSRLPDGGTTDQLISTFNVTVSEDMDAWTVNTPVYDFDTFNGHTYLVTPSSLQWPDVEAYAQNLGGNLVAITDQAEQDWVFSRFGSERRWIGLSDAALEGTFVWSSGEAFVYDNWGSGFPYGDSANYYDYVVMDTDGFWYNFDYNFTSHPGIVEIADDTDSDGDGLPDVLDGQPNDVLNGWDLREAGVDGIFDSSSTPSTDDVIYDLRLASTYTSGTNISLQVYDGPMHDGNYRLTITSSLTDVVGNQLDGDGDSTAGGNYVQEFFVDLPDGFVYEGRSNDTLVEATPLPLVEDPAGSGLFLGFGLGSQDPAAVYDYWSDPDYWRFDAEAGDRVAIAVDTPDSDVDPYVELRNASDSSLTSDSNSGPGADAYISHYTILSAGTYYLRVGKDYYSSVVGNYAVRVELARNIELESDADYNNDSIAGADPLTYTTVGNQRSATIAGTIMAGESGNVDEDYYALGTIEVGETAFSRISLPDSSTLIPVIEIRNASDNVVSINPNPTDASIARYDVDTTGEYYVVIVAQGGEGVFGQYLLDTTIGPTNELQFADLSVTNIELPTPPDVTTGDTIHLEWTVGNYGTAITDTDTWYDRIVLSENDTYGDSDDRYLVSVERNGTLAVDDTYVGQVDVALPLDVAGSFYVFVETDEDGWVYEFTLTDNNFSPSTEQLNINNDRPTADPDGPYTVDEGGSVVLDGSGSSDPNQSSASLTYHWDLDYDSVTFDEDATGISPTVDASGLDGPQTLTVALRVTDAAGSSHIATTTMDVNNMPPLVAADNTTVTVDEGDPATNAGTFSDPGDDTVTLSASIGTVVDNGSGTWSWSFDTADGPNQSQTVTISATDSDSAASSTSFSLTVSNVTPTLTVVGNQSVDEGSELSIADLGVITDPGFDHPPLSTVESFTFSIDWGDGTAADTGSATIDDVGGVGGDLTDASCDGIHTYADHGLHTVTVRVADDDMSGNFTTGTAGADFVEQSFQVTVNDTTPPTVSEVMVSSTGWTSDFKDAVDGVTVAGTGIGYGIPTGAHQLDPLPWINVDEVHFLFSEDVTIVQGDLGLFGVNTPDYAAQITGSVFSYDDSTFTASWTLSSSLTVDKLLAALDPTNVTDLAGNPIGTNEFRFNLLPGDANQSGVVLGSDVGQVRLNQGALGETNYSIFNDLNGSGTVLGSDVGAARLRQFDFLPAGEPSMTGSGSLALVARRFANGASASEVMSGPRLSRNSHAPRWLLERPATAAPTEAVDLALTPGASNRGGYGDQSEIASLALATAGIRRDANVELEFEADPWEKVVDTVFTGLKPVFKESLD